MSSSAILKYKQYVIGVTSQSPKEKISLEHWEEEMLKGHNTRNCTKRRV